MSFYPKAVNERVVSPANSRANSSGTAGKSASFVCGSFIEVSVAIDADSGSIDAAKFQTNGCGFMIATADVLCDWLNGNTLTSLHGLDDSELMHAVTSQLGTFPADRLQCAGVVFEALRSSMSLYRERRVEEFQGEKALICTCFGITEESIVAAISANGLAEVDQVAEACRAGSGCGSCRFLIQELIDIGGSGFD